MEGRFNGSGGREIYWQSWQPAGAARAHLVIAHGAAEHSGRYAPLGQRLAQSGFAVWALDVAIEERRPSRAIVAGAALATMVYTG